ncbi:uncharacterized protein (TIGR04255 family) [Arthrobacter sp. UYNi723]
MELLQFERPPVRKARLAVYFDLEAEVQVSHLAGYIQNLKSTYSDVAERAPLEPWRGLSVDQVNFVTPGSSWPFPLLVLSDDKGSSIALQTDRMVVTWSFESSKSPYPGYEELKKNLHQLLEEYRHAIKNAVNEDISIRRFECFYENAITEVSGPDLAAGILSNWTAAPTTLGESSYLGARFEYRHKEREDNLSTLAGVDSSEDEDSTELWIKVTRDRLETESNSIDGMDTAHEELIRAFKQYTNEQLRKGWGEFK